jgi:2,3-bisphosphoglycerate-independent phosphoglycerate mutase
MSNKKTYALIILDGWGYSTDQKNNAIADANTPTWDRLWATYPHCLLSASGEDVGLPDGQMGNSEVGHITIGAGRVMFQDLVRINNAIKDKSFFKNPALIQLMQNSKDHALHIFGLLSDGGIHSHINHLFATLELAKQQGLTNIYVNPILDGRDTPPRSAQKYLEQLQAKLDELGIGRIASICGRYYAMDRDRRYERTELAYNLYTQGKAEYQFPTAVEALQAAYSRDENDEFVKPTIVGEPVKMQTNDCALFFNYRTDRMRQLVAALSQKDFSGFKREYIPQLKEIATFTQYQKEFDCPVMFPPQQLHNVLGEYLSAHHLTQLRIAETEKYAHVTFFINGGREAPFEGEERILIPSPKVATYDLQPEMSAIEVTDKLVEAIDSNKFDAIICNFANPDMVGHTGNLQAAIKAIETIDSCLAKILAALQSNNGEALITADHGNAERMFNDETNQPFTAHTTNLVPLVYIGRPAHFTQEEATLSDIAPTLIHMMGMEPPKEMTGKNLLDIEDENH